MLLPFIAGCAAAPPSPRSATQNEYGSERALEAAGFRRLGDGSWTFGDARPSPRSSTELRTEVGSASALESAGFRRIAGGSSAFDGALHVETGSFEEWALDLEHAAGSRWWREVDAGRGWAVEARLRVLRSGQCPSVGFWIHDRTHLVKVGIDSTRAGFTYPVSRMREIGPTAAWRTYRVEGRGGWVRLRVDGAVVAELREPELGGGGGSQTLMFGDLGGCDGSISDWQYFTYDTRPDLECTSCEPREHFLLADLRTQLDVAIDARNTEQAGGACLAQHLLERFARTVLANVAQHDSDDAAALRVLAPLGDHAAISAARTVLSRAFGMLGARWASDAIGAFIAAEQDRPEAAFTRALSAISDLAAEERASRADVESLARDVVQDARACARAP